MSRCTHIRVKGGPLLELLASPVLDLLNSNTILCCHWYDHICHALGGEQLDKPLNFLFPQQIDFVEHLFNFEYGSRYDGQLYIVSAGVP